MCKIELKISYDCCPGRLLKGGEYNLYLLTPGVLIEKHYIRVAILCYKTYYLSRGVSSESVFLPFLEFLLRGVLLLSQGMPTAGIYLGLATSDPSIGSDM